MNKMWLPRAPPNITIRVDEDQQEANQLGVISRFLFMTRFLADILRKTLKRLCSLDLKLQRKISASPEAQVFSYQGPRDVGPDRKEVVRLAKNNRVSGAIQVVKKSTPDNLHSHATQDGFWFILKGRARFHGENGPIGEFGPYEGILTPRDFKYWYESIGDCDLEMLQVLAIDEILGRHRESFRPDQFDRSLTERSDHRGIVGES